MNPLALLLLPALISTPPSAPTPAPKNDSEMEALTRAALASPDPAQQKAALKQLRGYTFKKNRVPEREFCLYAQGMLEERLGEPSKAAETLRKLERAWPSSPYLPEAQIVMAQEAIEKKRVKEAEGRLKKVLDSDELPVENRRRAQELMLWALVEQGHAEEAIPISQGLQPRGSGKPSERGLVAMVEVFAAAKDKGSAASARREFHNTYPQSPLRPRLELAWARFLGTEGDQGPSAEAFRKLLEDFPKSPEADEARLALATLLTEGRLSPKKAKEMPNPEDLIKQLGQAGPTTQTARRALLVQTRMHLGAGRWKEALDSTIKLKASRPTAAETETGERLAADALKGWVQACLSQGQATPLLPYLGPATILALSPEQRRGLAGLFAQQGLPEASRSLIGAAPDKEREALRRVAFETSRADLHPEAALALAGKPPGNPLERLRRGQALVALGKWNEGAAALEGAKPGPERISALLAFLRRPLGPKETPRTRLGEAEARLGRAPEKGATREPLVILVADLRAQQGDWRGALALYPEEVSPEQRGWVALMRATCQARLGQWEAARSTLKKADAENAFKSERQRLQNQLGS